AAGWGVATLFPAGYRAADDLPGVPQGVGITVVGWFARLGFFVSPPVVGALADALTLRYALWMMPLYAVGILVFAVALGTRTVHSRRCAGRAGSRPRGSGPRDVPGALARDHQIPGREVHHGGRFDPHLARVDDRLHLLAQQILHHPALGGRVLLAR